MRFREWIGYKIAGKNQSNGRLTDDDRLKAIALKRQETALRQAERQLEFMERLSKLEYSANPKESITDTLLKQAIPVLLQKITKQENNLNPNNQDLELTEQQIDDFISKNPKLVEHSVNFSKEDITAYLKNQIPTLSTKSLNIILSKLNK